MYMAMPSSGNAVGEKVGQWVPDERDGFISWIRSEFAAANAMIDSMCQHLKMIGGAGEYDVVIAAVQQRRLNWYPVLHMQHYFSITDVVHSLQQAAAWRRQQQARNDQGHFRYFDKVPPQQHGRRFGGGGRGSYRNEANQKGGDAKIISNDDKAVEVEANKNDVSTKPLLDICEQNSVNSQANMSDSSDHEGDGVYNGFTSNTAENGSSNTQGFNEKQRIKTGAKTFVGNEIVDGKAVNTVDGMKLYESLLDHSEVTKLVTLVNDMRNAGRSGQFQGPTFVMSPRPAKGHGREMIQLGIPIADGPSEDEIIAGTFKDRRSEPIPSLLQNVIERLTASQIITEEPDSCIIDFFSEGDYLHPHMWPHWFGRPVCVLFLTECDMTFGKAIVSDRTGDYKGSIKLSFTPGSMLVMQGRSTDFARHAIPALRKQRVLVTLTKAQPKRYGGGHLYPSATTASPSHCVPPTCRTPNHLRHPMGSKHHIPAPTTGVLPAPPICTPLPPPNAVQPIFVPAAVAPGMPFPAPVAMPPPTSAGWSIATTPRHPTPRLPVPGTGVFLPPGSGNASNESLSTEAAGLSENDNAEGKLNGNSSASNGNVDGKLLSQECNGTVDDTGGEGLEMEDQHSVNLKLANEPSGAA